MAIRYIEQDRTFWLDTEHTSYLLAIVDQENFVGHIYYGQKLQYTENAPAPLYLMRTGEAPFVPSQTTESVWHSWIPSPWSIRGTGWETTESVLSPSGPREDMWECS